MAPHARRAAPPTDEDVRRLPAHLVGEILDGDLHATPRPRLRHGRSAWKLGISLDGPFDRGAGGPGGWIFLAEPELHLGPDIIVPDLAGWHRERLPALPDEAYLTLAPDWVCEIASPSTARLDRGVKMDIYLREGVSHLWLLDPIARFIEVFRLTGGQWVRVGVWTGDDPAQIEPFDAVTMDLTAVWGD
jgi:Uma2 family endonuclease